MTEFKTESRSWELIDLKTGKPVVDHRFQNPRAFKALLSDPSVDKTSWELRETITYRTDAYLTKQEMAA